MTRPVGRPRKQGEREPSGQLQRSSGRGMKRANIETMTIPRPLGQMPRRVIVERRALPAPVFPLWEGSYYVTGGFRYVEKRPIAREVSRLLRNEPMRFPEELRSDS